jgi:hypothetical protein
MLTPYQPPLDASLTLQASLSAQVTNFVNLGTRKFDWMARSATEGSTNSMTPQSRPAASAIRLVLKEANLRYARDSTANPDLQQCLYSLAFDPSCNQKLTHEFPHSRKVLVEDRDHAAAAIGPNCVVHELPLFCLGNCVVGTELAPQEGFTVMGAVVKNNPIDISIVVGALFGVLVLQ